MLQVAVNLQTAVRKCSVRKLHYFFENELFLMNSERKLVANTLIHISPFPLQFPMSKNVILPLKKKTIDIAFLVLLWLLSIWSNPNCISCYTDIESNYSLQNWKNNLQGGTLIRHAQVLLVDSRSIDHLNQSSYSIFCKATVTYPLWRV